MKITKIFVCLLALLAFSCDNDVNVNFPEYPNFPPDGTNCLEGEGSVISEARTPTDDFNSIDSFIFADILLTQGPAEDIILEGQRNIIDQINTDVVNDELRLTLDRCVSISEAVTVDITIPEIENITLMGVGNVIAQNDLDLTELEINFSGVGDFRLRGTSENLEITFTGVGDINAFDLTTDICDINMSGVGNVEVFVNDELNVTITGAGNVYYRGNPTITSNITGTGSLIDAN